jgi:peptidoglycan hydrolase CwlO-like protein
MTAVLPDLDRLQSAANQSATILGHMRIEKWKADNNTKQQAQQNADSIQRNVTAALPGMISAVRSAPQDLNAEFRLYRNVNVLYDVMGSLAESAGAFGPKNDFENLAQQLEIIDSVRHNLGDSVERLTASTEYELNQLRTQLRAAQERQVAPAAAPKTVVVDDNAPAKKTTTTHKKKTAASKPAASGDASGSSTPSNPSPPKQ